MKKRIVTRAEAEEAYNLQVAGRSLPIPGHEHAVIDAVHLPPAPRPSIQGGTDILPLTYECSVDGRTHTIIAQTGPGVEELRAFLLATMDGLEAGEGVELWFENGHTSYPGLH